MTALTYGEVVFPTGRSEAGLGRTGILSRHGSREQPPAVGGQVEAVRGAVVGEQIGDLALFGRE